MGVVFPMFLITSFTFSFRRCFFFFFFLFRDFVFDFRRFLDRWGNLFIQINEVKVSLIIVTFDKYQIYKISKSISKSLLNG